MRPPLSRLLMPLILVLLCGQDDQETPDSHMVAYEFPDRKMITWEGLSCNTQPSTKYEIVFFGENGSVVLSDAGFTINDPKGKELKKFPGEKVSQMEHFNNWLASIRSGGKLNSEIEEGHKSTLLCHLGNIAKRTGRALKCDPEDGHVTGDKDAMALWTREYAKGWEPKV
jgi:hypothetical protein